MTDIQNKIEEYEKEYDAKMCKLAEEYSQEVLIPFCKKYGLNFAISMGEFYFYRDLDLNEIINPYHVEGNNFPNFVPKDAIPELKEIIRVLNIQAMPQNCYFGYYVKPIVVIQKVVS